jgi:Zn-dependent protease with chaperone function
MVVCIAGLICACAFWQCKADPIPRQSDASQPVTTQLNAPQTPPASQAYSLPPDKLARAIRLERIRNVLDIAGSVWSLVFLWLLLATSLAARMDAWAGRMFRRRWLQSLLFFAALLILITLAALPLDLYGNHISRNYGISVQGWPSWLGDMGKSLGITLLIGSPTLLLFHWIVRRWPRRFWFGAWLVTLPLMLISVFAEPLLEPIFNHYEPLAQSHPALVAKLEQVVARTGTNIPPQRMYLMNASAKTNGLNAYVSGLGATKRIVVWDTTAGRIPDDQVLFIFGHESGHYVLHHIPKTLAITAVALFFIYWACAAIAVKVIRRFGPRWGVNKSELNPTDDENPFATRAGFVVLIFIVSIAGFLIAPAANAISRHFEHEADIYGQEAIHGLVANPQQTAVASFNALGQAWLDDPDPNPIIEFWLYNHPSVKDRANFAAHYNPWANGGHGKFFSR